LNKVAEGIVKSTCNIALEELKDVLSIKWFGKIFKRFEVQLMYIH